MARSTSLFLLAVLVAAANRAEAQPPSHHQVPPIVAEGATAPTNAGVALSTLERLALAHNPTLVQAHAQIRISQGKALQAGLAPNPSLGYIGDQFGAGGTAGELHGLFVEQQIITAGKLRLSRAKYTQEARQAQILVSEQQFRVLYGVRVAYYETLIRKRRVAVHEELLQNANDIVVTLEELVNVGQANRTDYLKAKIQLQRETAELRAAERRYRGSWEATLAVAGSPDLNGEPADSNLDIEDDAALSKEATLARLLTYSPEMCFAQVEVVRDQIGLERERAEPVPNIQLRAESGYNFESNNTVGGLEVGFNLPIFDRNQGTIQQAQFELARAQAEVRRVELKLRQGFATTFADYEASALTSRTYRDESLPLAKEAYDRYVESFQRRRAAWPQVLDAQRDYLELMDDYLNELLAARTAEAKLSSMLLEDGLQAPADPTPSGHRDATPKPR